MGKRGRGGGSLNSRAILLVKEFQGLIWTYTIHSVYGDSGGENTESSLFCHPLVPLPPCSIQKLYPECPLWWGSISFYLHGFKELGRSHEGLKEFPLTLQVYVSFCEVQLNFRQRVDFWLQAQSAYSWFWYPCSRCGFPVVLCREVGSKADLYAWNMYVERGYVFKSACIGTVTSRTLSPYVWISHKFKKSFQQISPGTQASDKKTERVKEGIHLASYAEWRVRSASLFSQHF